MKMNLLDAVKNGIKETIKEKSQQKNIIEALENDNKKTPEKIIKQLDNYSAVFIKERFSIIDKGDCFKFRDLADDYFPKSFHSLVLYVLGIKLKEIFELFFVNAKDLSCVCIDMSDSFEYVWRLTSFYHDVMTKYEDTKTANIIHCYMPCISSELLTVENFINTCKKIKFAGIKYTIYDKKTELNKINNTLNTISPTYSKDVVNRYFRKRLSVSNIDHGIISGYVFYNQLICNYLKQLRDYQTSNLRHKVNEVFEHKGLFYRPEHLCLFKYIADAIIVHNIWHYDNSSEQAYKLWNLEKLSVKNRLSLKNNTLAFILGLLDTIEPTKYFKSFKPFDVLSSIKIESSRVDNQPITIILKQFKTKNKNNIDFNDWYTNKLKSMECWLDLTVEYNQDTKEIKITIPS